MTGKTDSVLNVEHFSLLFPARGKNAFAVNDISFSIGEGEIAGLVGESGCGKTMTALSCIGLQPESAVLSGSIRIAGKNALSFSEDDWTRERGKTVSMIFQECSRHPAGQHIGFPGFPRLRTSLSATLSAHA